MGISLPANDSPVRDDDRCLFPDDSFADIIPSSSMPHPLHFIVLFTALFVNVRSPNRSLFLQFSHPVPIPPQNGR